MSNPKVVKGRLITVPNKERKFGSALSYQLVWVEGENGGNERPLLFTPEEILKAEERANKNKEDILKKSFFTDLLD